MCSVLFQFLNKIFKFQVLLQKFFFPILQLGKFLRCSTTEWKFACVKIWFYK